MTFDQKVRSFQKYTFPAISSEYLWILHYCGGKVRICLSAKTSGRKISISDEERRKIQIFIRNIQSTTTQSIEL